jgi:alanyl-tRNA synthetase
MSQPTMTPTSADVRRAFLEFFASHGHAIVASSPLVPASDPTLMFTNAGMVQFKDVFAGREKRPYTRATSSQKCIRISGKHNDLENVGVTARHHTFFEMLGNFSFADYFKEEAIAWAWELLTRVYALDPGRMMITVFGGAEGVPPDDEARTIWRKVTGLSDARIVGIQGVPGDNFWQMGETGPCGPCTEIHWFNGDASNGVPYGTFGQEPTPDGLGWMEIWNVVFTQFDRSQDASGEYQLTPLPKPCVDTGAGLERMASVLQNVTSNYDTDLLRALVGKASALAGKPYGGSQGPDDVSMRVIADHARTAAFLIAEGVFPDRAGREYVLRRVMRRAVRHGHRLGIRDLFLHHVIEEVIAAMGGVYPELVERRQGVIDIACQEETRFRETLERGLKMLEEEIGRVQTAASAVRTDPNRAPSASAGEVSGATAFRLYDTFGFPLDLTQVIARERGLTVDEAGYEVALQEQRARSESSKLNDAVAVAHVWHAVRDLLGEASDAGVKFIGYEREEGEGRVVAIVRDGAIVARAEAGADVAIVTDVTPFYPEMGGQVGDRGVIRGATGNRSNGLEYRVEDTQRPVAGVLVHVGKIVTGSVGVGDTVRLEVDHELRTATRRNHSATHLLHWALRSVLGEQATQKGSLVGPARLRFDFAHGRSLTPEEIVAIEDLVNAKILTNAPVVTEVLPIDVARKRGAMAIFEEKYGDVVRVLTMTKDSVELCGGTHARALGEIGFFKIVSEQGLAAGVRRIEGATATQALAHVRAVESTLRSAAHALRAATQDVPEKVAKLLDRERSLEKEVAALKRSLAMGGGAHAGGGVSQLVEGAREIPGGKALALRASVSDPSTLRELAEKLRDTLGSSVVLVGAAAEDKALLVLTVSKDLTDRYHSGHLVRGVAAALGGSGGGRPDMAQAGGPDVAKLDEALAGFYARLARGNAQS